MCEQVCGFLAAAETRERLEELFVLAIATGIRLGELLGLKWSKVDLRAGVVRVVATLKHREGQWVWSPPKSRASRRQIVIAPAVVEGLRQHRQRQRLGRMQSGMAWEEQGVVFCDQVGRLLTDGHVRRHWRLLKAAGLPQIRLHDLRHTCATLLLAARVNPKVVSEMLGHSSVGITLDIYSHVLPDMQQDAAAVMGKLLFGWYRTRWLAC